MCRTPFSVMRIAELQKGKAVGTEYYWLRYGSFWGFFTAENVNLFLKKHSMSTVDVYLVSYSELTCVKRLEM